MKKRKPKGRLLMSVGLLCILCAAAMAARILLSERRSGQAAQTVLTELNQQIPHNSPAPTEETLQLSITDQSGLRIDWPMTESNIPMPWPVDSSGSPLPSLTDERGQTFTWQYDLNRPCIADPQHVLAQSTPTTASVSQAATSASPVYAESSASTTQLVSPSPVPESSSTSSTSATSAPSAAPISTEASAIAPETPLPADSGSPAAPTFFSLPQTDDTRPANSPPIGGTQQPDTSFPAASTPQPQDAVVTEASPTPMQNEGIPSTSWAQDSEGGLLPYVSDGQGQIMPWLTDLSGHVVSREFLLQCWQTLINQMTANWMALLAQPAFVRNPQMEMPITTLKGHEYIGILDIPCQSISLPIMSEWSYPKLKIAPCRYSGSAYSGDLIIAGHNSNGHFSPIKKLVVGDEVRFTDVDGNVFIYSVIGIDVVDANDVPSMLAGSDVWDLSLFTCSHSARKRTTIRCKLDTYLLPDAE